MTRNEVLCGLNVPEQLILALVEVDGAQVSAVRYVRRPFTREPDAGAASVNYSWREMWMRGEATSFAQ